MLLEKKGLLQELHKYYGQISHLYLFNTVGLTHPTCTLSYEILPVFFVSGNCEGIDQSGKNVCVSSTVCH